MARTRGRAGVVAGVVIASLLPLRGTAAAVDGDPAQVGRFAPAFEEAGERCRTDVDGRVLC